MYPKLAILVLYVLQVQALNIPENELHRGSTVSAPALFPFVKRSLNPSSDGRQGENGKPAPNPKQDTTLLNQNNKPNTSKGEDGAPGTSINSNPSKSKHTLGKSGSPAMSGVGNILNSFSSIGSQLLNLIEGIKKSVNNERNRQKKKKPCSCSCKKKKKKKKGTVTGNPGQDGRPGSGQYDPTVNTNTNGNSQANQGQNGKPGSGANPTVNTQNPGDAGLEEIKRMVCAVNSERAKAGKKPYKMNL
jgi:hypothetical protein